MKKLIILFTLLFTTSVVLASEDLSVKSNIDSGVYEFALEVNLIPSDKEAKIFYYTDGIGRMDNMKEFQKGNPIIIKETTTLNYYAFLDNQNSTKIEEKIYTINYPKTLKLIYSGGKLKIKNTGWKIANIGYRKIESANFVKEIYKNTFLDGGEEYLLDYTPYDGENLKLVSPDEKVILTEKIIYPKKVIHKEIVTEKIEENVITKDSTGEKIEEISEVLEISSTGNISELEKDNLVELELSEENIEFNSAPESTGSALDNNLKEFEKFQSEEIEDIIIKNTKTSTLESKNNSSFFITLFFLFIFLLAGIYNYRNYILMFYKFLLEKMNIK